MQIGIDPCFSANGTDRREKNFVDMRNARRLQEVVQNIFSMKVGVYEKDQNKKSLNCNYSKIAENKDEIPTRKDFSRKNPLERIE
jgi:hypothetical protein